MEENIYNKLDAKGNAIGGIVLPADFEDEVAGILECQRLTGWMFWEKKRELTHIEAVQNMLDNTAKAKRYDSILSACSYAAYPNQFQTEGQEFVAWRGAVWAKCYEILGEVEAGTRAAPTVSELLAEIATTIQTPGADNDTGS